jgi:hypothetical protein
MCGILGASCACKNATGVVPCKQLRMLFKPAITGCDLLQTTLRPSITVNLFLAGTISLASSYEQQRGAVILPEH